MIETRLESRTLESPLVFHVSGKKIGDWRKSWATACKKAGVPGRLFHDLRRTTVRNLLRAGVPEKVAQGVTGHKTRDVFDRYHIVSAEDLEQATNKMAAYLQGQSTERKVIPFQQAQNG